MVHQRRLSEVPLQMQPGVGTKGQNISHRLYSEKPYSLVPEIEKPQGISMPRSCCHEGHPEEPPAFPRSRGWWVSRGPPKERRRGNGGVSEIQGPQSEERESEVE